MKTISFKFLLSAILMPSVVCGSGWLSPVKITDNIYSDEVAAINYDGAKIAFYSDEDGDYDIFFMDLSEGAWNPPVKLTNNDTPDTMPDINDDGTKITYIGGSEENRDIFFVEYQDSKWQEPVQLTDSLNGDFFPSISSDGLRIIYQTKQITEGSEYRYIWFVERIDGMWQDPVEMPSDTDDNMFPVISGNGTKAAFFGKNNGYRDVYFLEYSENWHGLVDLTDNSEHDCQPSINNNGTKIVYYWTGDVFLPHVVPNAVADVRLLEYKEDEWQPPETLAGSPYYEYDPTIDAEGSRITYAESVPGVAEHTYITEFSEGAWQAPENLTNGITSGFRPNISGDGDTIVYYGTGTAKGVMDVDNEIYILKYAESLGMIAGHVADKIEKVFIITTPGNFLATTDSDGRYALNVPPGNYTVTAVKDCYAADSVSDINVQDGESQVADFNLKITGNCAPGMPENPFPENRSIKQPLNLKLTWESSDPDAEDTITYDVYVGLPTLHHIEMHIISGSQSEKFCSVKGLEPGLNYFWKVTARDSQGYETSGPLWSFTTCEFIPITFTFFTVTPESKKVIIKWAIKSEDCERSFNLYRSESEDKDYEIINDSAILPKDTNSESTTYEYIDDKGLKNRREYFYKLEEIETSALYGPEKATPKLFYRWLSII